MVPPSALRSVVLLLLPAMLSPAGPAPGSGARRVGRDLGQGRGRVALRREVTERQGADLHLLGCFTDGRVGLDRHDISRHDVLNTLGHNFLPSSSYPTGRGANHD